MRELTLAGRRTLDLPAVALVKQAVLPVVKALVCDMMAALPVLLGKILIHYAGPRRAKRSGFQMLHCWLSFAGFRSVHVTVPRAGWDRHARMLSATRRIRSLCISAQLAFRSFSGESQHSHPHSDVDIHFQLSQAASAKIYAACLQELSRIRIIGLLRSTFFRGAQPQLVSCISS